MKKTTPQFPNLANTSPYIPCYHDPMNGREFVRRARRYARRNRLTFDFDPSRGKGSHGQLIIGSRRTIVQHGEIAPNTFAAMLRQLEINRQEF